jgi:hypothetical protein
MRKESTKHRNGFLMETMSTIDPMHKKPYICHWEETTNFYGVNTTIPIGEIGRERENNYYLKTLPL